MIAYIRKSEVKKDKTTSNNNDYLYQAYDFTTKYYKALTESVEDVQYIGEQSHIVPSMAMSSFFTFMQKTFDCNVVNGKGSEMKIWRNGSKIYTLGRHK